MTAGWLHGYLLTELRRHKEEHWRKPPQPGWSCRWELSPWYWNEVRMLAGFPVLLPEASPGSRGTLYGIPVLVSRVCDGLLPRLADAPGRFSVRPLSEAEMMRERKAG